MTESAARTEPVVDAGAIVALRLFDIAYSIDLGRVEALTAALPGSAIRAKLSGTPEKAVAFGVPPVVLALDPVTVGSGDATMRAEVTARFYDFGAIALALALSFGLGNRELAGEITREWYNRYKAERDAIDREHEQLDLEDEAEAMRYNNPPKA